VHKPTQFFLTFKIKSLPGIIIWLYVRSCYLQRREPIDVDLRARMYLVFKNIPSNVVSPNIPKVEFVFYFCNVIYYINLRCCFSLLCGAGCSMRGTAAGPFHSVTQGSPLPCSRFVKVNLLVGEPIYFLVEVNIYFT
jgi:hypothetical protein